MPDFRGLAGRVASGIFRAGEEIVHLPSGLTARITAIHGPAGKVESAFHPMSVVMELDRALDIGRGDMLAKPNNQPVAATEIEVMLCWLGDKPLDSSRRYILQQTSRETKCLVREVRYKLDVTTLHRSTDHSPLQMNDLARVTLHTTAPCFFDSYKKNRQTGSLILVDEFANTTVAAGMIL
jgi:sulfate adenylyltransferase subunit 1 (EFTu-like GTPase family)